MTITPKSIKLRGEGNTLAVEWSDTHHSAYPYQYLRDHCPCATCTGNGREAAPRPATPGTLPIYGTPLKAEKAELVGRYAVQIFWSDGHSTGIYTFNYLRELCPCAQCEAARAGVL